MIAVRSFYVASSRDRIDDVAMVASFLVQRGMRNTFAWPDHFTHRCSAETCGVRDRADLARRELAAAGTCDLFVGIARLGKGTHVEIGAALFARDRGHPKRIILVGVDRADSVFYDDAKVEHSIDVPGLLAALRLGPWCDRCGDAFDGPERPCPRPAPGRPYYDCGRGGHMFRLETEPRVAGGQ